MRSTKYLNYFSWKGVSKRDLNNVSTDVTKVIIFEDLNMKIHIIQIISTNYIHLTPPYSSYILTIVSFVNIFICPPKTNCYLLSYKKAIWTFSSRLPETVVIRFLSLSLSLESYQWLFSTKYQIQKHLFMDESLSSMNKWISD